MSTAFEREYERRVSEHQIDREADHAPVVAALGRLSADLADRRGDGDVATEGAKGVYIWGRVGRGKSMLMDLFYECASEPLRRRVHFHAFMQEVHAAMQPSGGDCSDDGLDLISRAARTIARETRLLCLDELEVTDIADAMILGRLFDRLFEAGAILVATSNDHPDDLYRDGPNHDLFAPFVERLKEHVDVVRLGGSHDHRTDGQQDESTFLTPVTDATKRRFEELWQNALGKAVEESVSIGVHGRHLSFPRSGGGNLRVTFGEVCGEPLGADDHLAIAARFGSVFLEDVPVIKPEQVEEGRRFVTLVDALYEARTRLVVLGEADPDGIFERTVSDDQRRTVSRLHEMSNQRIV